MVKKQVIAYPTGPAAPGAAPLATRYGSFLFFSMQTGFDAETGQLVGPSDVPIEARATIAGGRPVDELEWPTTAQTWKIYDNLRALLESQGASLDNLVRTNTFFRDLEDFPAMERTRAEILRRDPPASTVLEIPDRGLRAGALVMIDGLAAVPDADMTDFRKEAVKPAGMIKAPAHFSLGIKAGPFVLPSGQTGYSGTTGEYINSIQELPAEAQWLATGNRHLDSREGPILAQTWAAYDNIRRIIGAAGCSMNDILKETIFLRHMKHAAAVDVVRRKLFPDASDAPASTIVQVADLGRIKGTLIEIDVIALAPTATAGWRKESVLAVGGLRSRQHGPVATKAGPFVFVSGLIGLDPTTGSVPQSIAELSDRRLRLEVGRLYQETPAVAQASAICDQLARVLKAAGSSGDQILKLDVYLQNLADLPAIQGLNALTFGSSAPAMRTITMEAVDRRSDAVVALDAIACIA